MKDRVHTYTDQTSFLKIIPEAAVIFEHFRVDTFSIKAHARTPDGQQYFATFVYKAKQND